MHVKLIIAGGRDFDDYDMVVEHMKGKRSADEHTLTIITGSARGADTLGAQYADDNHIPSVLLPADWRRHGRSAGYIRNEEMARNATHLLAFWDGKSKGTGHMIDIAYKHKLKVKVVYYT
jgi:hypothetical protein